MNSATLQDDLSVESFFKVVETETLTLFKDLSYGFLEEFGVFAPEQTGRTRDHESPEMMRGFLHYYKDIYGIRQELRNHPLVNRSMTLLYTGNPLASDPFCAYVPDGHDEPVPEKLPCD